ncbi:MAG: bifunctional UDP-N-acetylmuramoyl-tripeptide:D-alanyl-D-alanine ligase/alanine racemase [Saprospiraceae bacterium]|nr:bifunctional UDP-N-acetylmuramoyl-tripeptide:D-alanyl-D-alanine ligase/alanine racemase [Saprospiraceae bacterium]
MNYTEKEIYQIIGCTDQKDLKPAEIEVVSIDSRVLILPRKSLFFALSGNMHDGHEYIDDAYQKGVRNFVVNHRPDRNTFTNANFFVVENPLRALQKLATYHQKSFPQLRKIAITGSNGKTIIKEWLYQMLFDQYNVVKSPKSYNSQIGVALSICGIKEEHQLGIFEVGISTKNEMKYHLKMLDPDIGLFTNIGSAHDEGFASRKEKLEEKMLLFANVKTLIYRKDHTSIKVYAERQFKEKNHFTWSDKVGADVMVVKNLLEVGSRLITIQFEKKEITLRLHYTDNASYENCMHCVATMCFLGMSLETIQERINRISGLHMRMEMTTGVQQSILINDAYSADLDALKLAIEFVNTQAGNRKKAAILSAFDQSGKDEEEVFQQIVAQLTKHNYSDLIYISDKKFYIPNPALTIQFFQSKERLLDNIHLVDIYQKAVLIKGARRFGLEHVSDRLSEKVHSTILQINLNAIENNLRVYKNVVQKTTKIIAVIKASAYGSGSAEVARLLARNGVEHLAVAFIDEGIALRKAGITGNIIVFNPDLSSLPDIIRYRLEPEVFEENQLLNIIRYSNHNQVDIGIHLKIDSGMHRLGFMEQDVEELQNMLKLGERVNVRTIFSHLASSEDENDDAYTKRQFLLFEKMYEKICTALEYRPRRHILNSGGITRFPEKQYDYVRLGIGMYGIDQNMEVQPLLQKVHRMYASLIQIKQIKAGESIGYNRKTILNSDSKIGIVNIGYADGLMRNVGNRRYSFKIQNKTVPILGNVCMDLTIVDLSQVSEPNIGDVVTIFDNDHSIEELARVAGTIPYEILSRISSRVNRKFVRE